MYWLLQKKNVMLILSCIMQIAREHFTYWFTNLPHWPSPTHYLRCLPAIWMSHETTKWKTPFPCCTVCLSVVLYNDLLLYSKCMQKQNTGPPLQHNGFNFYCSVFWTGLTLLNTIGNFHGWQGSEGSQPFFSALSQSCITKPFMRLFENVCSPLVMAPIH